MKSSDLPITEEIDFHYLLSLLPPLYQVPEFSWLPELFSIIDYQSLIDLCRYAGGETIKIPTLDQLADSVEALQWFYDVCIKKTKLEHGVPYRLLELYQKIKEIYYAGNNSTDDPEFR